MPTSLSNTECNPRRRAVAVPKPPTSAGQKGAAKSDQAPPSSTHSEYVGEGYSVVIQHCEFPRCDLYLGVNYPSRFCGDHR